MLFESTAPPSRASFAKMLGTKIYLSGLLLETIWIKVETHIQDFCFMSGLSMITFNISPDMLARVVYNKGKKDK